MKGEWRRLLALFALAASVRVLYVWSTPLQSAIASVDAWGYHRLALNLQEGRGFSLRWEAPFVPDSVRTPLYPLFLWLVRRLLGPEPRMAAFAQAFLDACTTLCVWRLAASLGGRRPGRIAALLYALNPSQVRYTNELLTETLLSFLLVLCVCALARYLRSTRACLAAERVAPVPGCPGNRMGAHSRFSVETGWLLLAAAVSGLAILCKPNAQYLPVIWMLVIVLRHGRGWQRALAHAAGMACVVALMLVPWVARNRAVFGRSFLSTAFEGNISRVSAPATLAALRGTFVSPWSAEWEALFGELVSQAADRYRWDQRWDTLGARDLDVYNHQVYLVAREVLYRHPLAWLKSHAGGIMRYLEPRIYQVLYRQFSGAEWPPDVLEDAVMHAWREIGRGDWAGAGQVISQERWSRLTPLQRLFWWGTLAGQVIGLSMALRGAWKLRHQPPLVLLLLGTTVYMLWLPGPIAYERFRVPVMGLILALVGVSCSGHLTRPFRAVRGSVPLLRTRPYVHRWWIRGHDLPSDRSVEGEARSCVGKGPML